MTTRLSRETLIALIDRMSGRIREEVITMRAVVASAAASGEDLAERAAALDDLTQRVDQITHVARAELADLIRAGAGVQLALVGADDEDDDEDL